MGKALSLAQVGRGVGATRFINFCRLVGLQVDLTSKGPFTIFAPSNRALAGKKEKLLNRSKNDTKFVYFALRLANL